MNTNSSAAMPETILQFGTGRFLRAFADFFVQQANDEGQNVGRIVVVQSTGTQRADGLNANPEGYHVAVRGLENGQIVDRTDRVASISRALTAATQWPDVLTFAASPALRWIISNTTEAGYALHEGDRLTDQPPQSFPAKLTQVLWQRFQKEQAPVTLLPCELMEGNASKLRVLVLDLAKQWSLPEAFRRWAGDTCLWLNNLVDRIVVLSASGDSTMLTTEPYALWAIAKPPGKDVHFFRHPSIEIVDDLAPYYLRKVRILNGIHTALVARFMPQGFRTVQEALKDPAVMDWVLGLLYEEIIPVIAHRVQNVSRFARQVLDRLQNPFLEHKLADIAVNHEEKKRIRSQTTCEEYERLFGKKPRRLVEVLFG